MDNLCYELGSPADANSRDQKATILFTIYLFKKLLNLRGGIT